MKDRQGEKEGGREEIVPNHPSPCMEVGWETPTWTSKPFH